MRYSKKIFLGISILLMMVLVVGCFGGSSSDGDSDDPINATYNLTVGVSPDGAGTITKNPAQDSYEEGVTVELTATKNDGYVFDHWEGSGFDGNTDNPLTVPMTDDLILTAVFTGDTGDTGTGGWQNVGEINGSYNPSDIKVTSNGDMFATYNDNSYVYALKVVAGSDTVEDLGEVCGGKYGNSAFVLDSSNQPIVLGYNSELTKNVVEKWNGTSWEDLGLADSVTGEADATVYMDITIDNNDNIYIALGLGYPDESIEVYKYDNSTSTWIEISMPRFDEAGYERTGGVSVASDSQGNLYLGYGWIDDNQNHGKPIIAKWDGSSWSNIGGTPFISENLGMPEVKIDSSDNLYTFVNNKIFKYDGSNLDELSAQPTTSTDTEQVSFQIDSQDNKYALVIDKPEDELMNVEQWDGTSWESVFSFEESWDNDILLSSTESEFYIENNVFYHIYLEYNVWNDETLELEDLLKIRKQEF